MIDQCGDFIRVTPLVACLISVGTLSLGVIIGLIIGIPSGERKQRRKDPETEQKHKFAIRDAGRMACDLYDFKVFVKSVELSLADFNGKMRSKK